MPVPHLFEIVSLCNDEGICIGSVSHVREIDSAELLFNMNRLNRTNMKFEMHNEN